MCGAVSCVCCTVVVGHLQRSSPTPSSNARQGQGRGRGWRGWVALKDGEGVITSRGGMGTWAFVLSRCVTSTQKSINEHKTQTSINKQRETHMRDSQNIHQQTYVRGITRVPQPRASTVLSKKYAFICTHTHTHTHWQIHMQTSEYLLNV